MRKIIIAIALIFLVLLSSVSASTVTPIDNEIKTNDRPLTRCYHIFCTNGYEFTICTSSNSTDSLLGNILNSFKNKCS